MKHFTPIPILLALGCLLLAACSGGPEAGAKRSDGFPAPDKELVFQYAMKALQDQGFAPDFDLSDPVAGTIVTRWKLNLAPFSSKGYRDQATVTISEIPGRKNYFMTETRVIRQTNSNQTQPSNILVAEWDEGQRMAEIENLINRRIEMEFLPSTLSDDYRMRHGLQPGGGVRVDTSDLPPTPVR